MGDHDSAAGVTDLREKRNPVKQQPQLERGGAMWERNDSADTKVRAEEGAGGAAGSRAEIPPFKSHEEYQHERKH